MSRVFTSMPFPPIVFPIQSIRYSLFRRPNTSIHNVPLGEVNIGLLADQVGVTTTNTLDLGQGDHDLLLAVNISVEQTQDVLEVCLLVGHERYQEKTQSAFTSFNSSISQSIHSVFSIFFIHSVFENSFQRTIREQQVNVHIMGEGRDGSRWVVDSERDGGREE